MRDVRGIAVVTGASSGLGACYARLLAERNFDLIVVGRHGARLESVARSILERHPVRIERWMYNLSVAADRDEIARRLGSHDNIEILINCAGVGVAGDLSDLDPVRLREMLEVNVLACTELCRVVGGSMKARSRGRILNIAAAGAQTSGAGVAAYWASKAYVQSMSQALSYELRSGGVTVLCQCPGPMATPFAERSGLLGTRAFLARQRLLDPMEVARSGLNALFRGASLNVPGVASRWWQWCALGLPRPLAHRWLAKRFRRDQTKGTMLGASISGQLEFQRFERNSPPEDVGSIETHGNPEIAADATPPPGARTIKPSS